MYKVIIEMLTRKEIDPGRGSVFDPFIKVKHKVEAKKSAHLQPCKTLIYITWIKTSIITSFRIHICWKKSRLPGASNHEN